MKEWPKQVPSHLIKTNVTGYYKTPKLGILINANRDEYLSHVQAKAKSLEMRMMKEELSDTKEAMRKLHEMVQAMMQKKDINV